MLISLGWRDRSRRLALFKSYVRIVLLYGCSLWGVTKLDGRGRVGVDCTGELGTFYILGFDVWFCLFVTVGSAVAAVCVCVCFACTVHMLHMFAMHVGQIHKRG